MKRQRELDPRGRTTSKNCGPLARDFFGDNENRLFYNFKNKLATFRKIPWTLIIREGHLPINVYIQLMSGIIRVVMYFE